MTIFSVLCGNHLRLLYYRGPLLVGSEVGWTMCSYPSRLCIALFTDLFNAVDFFVVFSVFKKIIGHNILTSVSTG